MKKPPSCSKNLFFLILSLPFFFSVPSFAQSIEDRRPSDFGRTWQDLPIVPELNENSLRILKAGIAAGHNPHAFSKVGDCDTSTDWYLADFDKDSRYYNLGEYRDRFEPVLSYYKGSFSHRSLAAKPGFSAASVLSNYWLDFNSCEPDELPLTCEYRIQNSLIVLISLGTNDGYNPPAFKENLRTIIEITLSENRLPILMTKADNVEGDFSINQDIADLAQEYDLPLWNFWAAIQDLPNHGLVEDGIHLTFYKNDFADPNAFNYAWTYRNLTALQLLEKLMQATEKLQNK